MGGEDGRRNFLVFDEAESSIHPSGIHFVCYRKSPRNVSDGLTETEYRGWRGMEGYYHGKRRSELLLVSCGDSDQTSWIVKRRGLHLTLAFIQDLNSDPKTTVPQTGLIMRTNEDITIEILLMYSNKRCFLSRHSRGYLLPTSTSNALR